MIQQQIKTKRILKVRPLREIQNLLENENYKTFYEKREKIKSKYPPLKDLDRREFKMWLKEISSLIFENDGDFQKFLWDNIPEHEKVIMERKARGKKRRGEDDEPIFSIHEIE